MSETPLTSKPLFGILDAMKMRGGFSFRPGLSLFLFFLPLLLSPAAGRAETIGEDEADHSTYFKETGPSWIISPGINGGYNKLVRGYKDYEDLGNAGVDIYFRPPQSAVETPNWTNRMMFRLSGDWFPLQLPPGPRGLTEDVFSLNGTVVYKIQSFARAESKQWTPFLGLGFGGYWDRVSLDTPASGKITGTHFYWGINADAGFMLPAVFGVRLVPEVRYHTAKTPNNYYVANMTYQMGAVLWFDPKVYD